MIKIVAGVPGSGKSYYMVKGLSKYFTFDPFFNEFHVKDNVLIVSNIDGLKIPHLKIDSPQVLGNPDLGIVGKFTREEFFTIPNFEKLMAIRKVGNVILAIDEAQKDWLFPLGYKDNDVDYFFAYHRHIGVDCTIGTQDVTGISRKLLNLSETIANATPRSKGIIGNFSYKITDRRGKFMTSKVLRKDKNIFNAYQSMSVDEIEKPKNVLLYWAVVAVAFLVVGGLLFKTALASVKAKSTKSQVAQSSAIPPGAQLTHGQFSSNKLPVPVVAAAATVPVLPVIPVPPVVPSPPGAIVPGVNFDSKKVEAVVPEPIIVPAINERVLEACATN